MSGLGRLRRPEYVGEHRCWPCTVGNAVILAVGCLVLGVLGSYLAAFLLGLVGTGFILFRGYLVPYTPRLTASLRQRFPDLFPGGTSHGVRGTLADAASSASDHEAEELLSIMIESGVLRDEGTRLHLAEEVEGTWHAEMERLRDADAETLAREIEAVSPAANVTTSEQDGQSWLVLSAEDGSVAGETWLSRPGAIAEVAAVTALADHLENSARLSAARSLRTFLTTCPACTTPLEESSTASCCGGVPDVKSGPDTVAVCPTCDVWLYRVGQSV